MKKFCFFLNLLFVLILYAKEYDCVKVRKSRTLVSGNTAGIGILAAVAVPLELPHRNVFMSYNFEANYNSPYLASDYIPGPLSRLDLIEGRKNSIDYESAESSEETSEPGEESETNETKKRAAIRPSLLSRKKAFHILEEKLKYSGFHGKPCLLRMICEVNCSSISFNNGVLGDIFKIIFSPTTSKFENLPHEYYEAEFKGLNNNCRSYRKICPKSILSLISKLY